MQTLSQWLARKPAGRKKRKRIPAQSAKRQRDNREYLRLRGIFLAANRKCEVNWQGCLGLSGEIHHVCGRGKYLNDVTHFCAVCRPCHLAIHANPSLARACGLLK
jgi:hypothetical protein